MRISIALLAVLASFTLAGCFEGSPGPQGDKGSKGGPVDEVFVAKDWKAMTQWVVKYAFGPNEAVGAPIAAPNGVVLQFGPFQIPSTV